MAPPLIVKAILDTASYLRGTDKLVSSNTLIGRSALEMGGDYAKAAETQVAANAKVIGSNRALLVELQKVQATAVAGSDRRIAADLAVAKAQANLNRSLGLSNVALVKHGEAAKTAERDVGKLTRGVIAGSGVAASLGRSLAFASTGFIAVAGGATLLANSIREGEDIERIQRQVERQLQTSGKTWEEYGARVEAATAKESKLSGFTQKDLLQGFGYLVRVTGNVSTALRLQGVAADVARGRNISLSAASIALGKALGGSVTALRRLGIVIPPGVKGMAALNYVAEKFRGQAVAGATASDHFHATLVNMEDVIGKALLPTFERAVNSLTSWLDKMNETGQLQRDVKAGITALGGVLHTFEGIVKDVDSVTGSFGNTLKLLIALDLARHLHGWISSIEILAGKWGLVATEANAAATAEARALGVGGAAGAAGAARAAGTAESAVASAGGVALFGRFGAMFGGKAGVGGYSAAKDLNFTMKAEQLTRVEAQTARAFPLAIRAFSGMAELLGRFVPELAVVLVLLNTKVQESIAKLLTDVNKIRLPQDLLHPGRFGSVGGDILRTDRAGLNALPFGLGKIIGGATGLNAIGSVQDWFDSRSRKAALKAAADSLWRDITLGIRKAPPVPAPVPRQFTPNLRFLQPREQQPQGPFGTARPHFQATGFQLTITEQIQQAQAQLTNSTKDDVEVARKIIRRIKRILDEGNYTQKGYLAILEAEASAQGTIAQAQQQARQRAQAAASTYNVPAALQLAQAKAEAYGKDQTAILKQIIAAAEKAIHSGKKNWQGIIAALQVIGSARQQLQQTLTFQLPPEIQLSLARDEALGRDSTRDLKRARAAILKFIRLHRKNIGAITDAYQQLASINQQLGQAVLIPLKLQLALARAQALGTDQRAILEKMRAALYKALKKAKGNIEKQIEIWQQIASINDQLGQSVDNAYGDYRKASTQWLTQGLGLTAEQRMRLRARESQIGPGGTHPMSGTGAAGYIIDPETGRPIHRRPAHHRGSRYEGRPGGRPQPIKVDASFDIYIDGVKVEAVVTKRQQRRRRHNPSQRRGPNTATAAA